MALHVTFKLPGAFEKAFRGLQTTEVDFVLSQNRGDPNMDPRKFYSPYYGDPQKGYLILGNPSIGGVEALMLPQIAEVLKEHRGKLK